MGLGKSLHSAGGGVILAKKICSAPPPVLSLKSDGLRQALAVGSNFRQTTPMTITRQILIDFCDKFLNDEIDKKVIQDFAWGAITSDDFEFVDDEIISDTIFEWDNEDINFEINKTNIQLWKNRLLTGEDDLVAYNSWNSHIQSQKEICATHNSQWKPINKKLRVGVSVNLDTDPINGLRHPSEKGTTGWFIWTGDYSERDDFFQPMCAEHLLQKRPDIIKYLGLDIGFRFLADKDGYEDIWFDEKLKVI